MTVPTTRAVVSVRVRPRISWLFSSFMGRRYSSKLARGRVLSLPSMAGTWEERWHPLREEWVIVAAHRQNRPWVGEVLARPAKTVPAYDPSCTFCPGNPRVSGARNPAYERVFVFDNDLPCVGPDLAETGRVLFQDVLAAERSDGRRILAENGSAIAFVPYFARYAYEVYVAPLATHPSLADLSNEERRGLAQVLKSVLVQYDNLWKMSFPYVMALHQAPTDGGDHRGFHFHIELHPPLRKPDLLKYLAGPEIGGGR